jgi:hypothetical protein
MTNFILPYVFIGLIIAIILAAFISKIGEKRKIGKESAFIVSLLLGPLVGLIIVLASDELEKEVPVKKPEAVESHQETAQEKEEEIVQEEVAPIVPEVPRETHEEYVERKQREQKEADEDADKFIKGAAILIVIAIAVAIIFANADSLSFLK